MCFQNNRPTARLFLPVSNNVCWNVSRGGRYRTPVRLHCNFSGASFCRELVSKARSLLTNIYQQRTFLFTDFYNPLYNVIKFIENSYPSNYSLNSYRPTYSPFYNIAIQFGELLNKISSIV